MYGELRSCGRCSSDPMPVSDGAMTRGEVESMVGLGRSVSPIERALNQVETQLDRLSTAISDMEKSVSPVLTPHGSVDGHVEGVPSAPESEITTALLRFANRITVAAHQLEALRERVEL